MWSDALLYTWWMSDPLSRPYTRTLYCFVGLLLEKTCHTKLFFALSFCNLCCLALVQFFFSFHWWECFIYAVFVGNRLPLLCAMLCVPDAIHLLLSECITHKLLHHKHHCSILRNKNEVTLMCTNPKCQTASRSCRVSWISFVRGICWFLPTDVNTSVVCMVAQSLFTWKILEYISLLVNVISYFASFLSVLSWYFLHWHGCQWVALFQYITRWLHASLFEMQGTDADDEMPTKPCVKCHRIMWIHL